MRKVKAKIIDAAGLERTITRLAHEILEKNKGAANIAIVGIRTRGEFLAKRIAKKIEEVEGVQLPIGFLDITLYRDDLSQLASHPLVRKTSMDFDLTGRTILLIDDVIYTGRTIRAAMNELFDYGRPSAIQLAILVDRGGRQLPIQADFTGTRIDLPAGQNIQLQREAQGSLILRIQ